MLASGTAYIILHESEKKMDYLDYGMSVCDVSKNALPKPPEFKTIYISGGKKNKFNKIDIVGFFLKRKIVKRFRFIEVKISFLFAAVKSKKVKDLLSNIRMRNER
jgi:hypothetical protein